MIRSCRYSCQRGNSHSEGHKTMQGSLGRRSSAGPGSRAEPSPAPHADGTMNSSHSFSRSPSASLHGAAGGWGRPGSFPRARSVHGGAGGVRVSLSFAKPSCAPPGGPWGSGRGGSLLGENGKATMQNLNDRLASYLDKVRALEEANERLENRILKWHQERDPGGKQDYSQYEESVTHLQEQKGKSSVLASQVRRKLEGRETALLCERARLQRLWVRVLQIADGKLANAKVVLLIDNARMAVDDFSLKYENEHSFLKDLEIEVEGLRKTLDNLTIVTTDLELEVEGMRKELILMKKRHEQEMEEHLPNDFKVDVKVDTTPGEDLIKVLEDMRQEYECIMKKKHQELDIWYKEQSATMSQEVASPAPVQSSSQSGLHELKRTFQALEIDLQTQCNKKCALENILSETRAQYSCQLQEMQQIISHYEEELGQLRQDLERQNSEYQVLLGIKIHLEKEIATYRQLLEENSQGIMEEPKSHVKVSAAPKIKAITQESVNGRVILSQVNEIQKYGTDQ